MFISEIARESVLKRAENVGRENLLSLGVCFGKFTKTGKFKLHVTALDYLAQYAKVKLFKAGVLIKIVQDLDQANC